MPFSTITPGVELVVPVIDCLQIGGIEAEFSRLTGHQYLAGLWDKNILHNLMWFTKVRERSRWTHEWRAPSWS